jgi:hypothetical protein
LKSTVNASAMPSCPVWIRCSISAAVTLHRVSCNPVRLRRVRKPDWRVAHPWGARHGWARMFAPSHRISRHQVAQPKLPAKRERFQKTALDPLILN